MSRRIKRLRQEEKRQAAKPVVGKKQPAITVSIRQPTRCSRTNQIEYSHHCEEPCRMHLRHPVIHAGRDQMRSDQSIRARTANKKAPSQEPKIDRLHAAGECVDRLAERAFRIGYLRGVLALRLAEGP